MNTKEDILKDIETVILESKSSEAAINRMNFHLIEEKLVQWTPLSAMLDWFLVGFLITISVLLAAWLDGNTTKYWLFTALLGFLLSNMGWLIIHFKNETISLFPYIRRFITYDEKQLEEWFNKEIKKVFKERYLILIPIPILMLVNTLWITRWFTYKDVWFGSIIADITFSVLCLLWFFVVIHHFQFAVNLARMLNKLVHLPFDTSIIFNSRESVKKLGNTFFYFAFHAVICLTILGFAFSKSPLELDFTVIIWILIAFAAVLIVLLTPQYNIHKVMIQVKQKYINAFTPTLTEAYERVVNDPNKENIERLAYIETIFERLKKTPEWPFDTSAAFSLLSAVIVPITLTLMQALLK